MCENEQNRKQYLPLVPATLDVGEPDGWLRGGRDRDKGGPPVTENTRIADVIADPLLGYWGRLLFPVNAGYYGGETLGELRFT